MSNHAPTASIEELLAHAGWARRLARRLTTDVAEAEDLLQDTWLAAVRHPPTTDRSLRPWLTVVLRNRFVNRAVRARRREARQGAIATEGAAVSAQVLAERVEAQRLLAELVAGLEEPYRQTLVMRYFDELSGAEIARRLEVPAGTVRWRLKTALDELRRQLDARQGGRREAWMAVLLPLGGPSLVRPRFLWPFAIGLAGLTLGLGLWVTGGPGGAPGAQAAAAPAPARSQWPSVKAAWSRLTEDLAACQLEVKRLREESAAVEAERRSRLTAEELFSIGEPNPAAVEALTPVIEGALRGPRHAHDHSLECRTYACRLLVLRAFTGGPRDASWPSPLEMDLEGGIVRLLLMRPSPTHDQVSGEAFTEDEVFLPLRGPFGARVRRDAPPAAPGVPDAPPPATPGACALERDRLHEEIRQAREDIEARALPSERFARGAAPNPKLAEEVRRQMVAGFPGMYTANMEVECRGTSCRARWPTGPMSWTAELQSQGPWFRTMVEKTAGDFKGLYLEIATRPRADGVAFLEKLVERFEKRAVAHCAARFPGRGTLWVRFELRGTGWRARGDEPARLSVRSGNALAGTPLGTCLEAAIASDILAARLPAPPVGHALLYRRFDFPRPGDQGVSPK